MTHPTPQGQLSPEEFDQFCTPNRPDGSPVLMAVEINRLRAEVEALRKRLAFLMTACDIEGFVDVEHDRYELAMQAADERGHEEPTAEDEVDGFIRLIDAALSQQSGSEVKNG